MNKYTLYYLMCQEYIDDIINPVDPVYVAIIEEYKSIHLALPLPFDIITQSILTFFEMSDVQMFCLVDNPWKYLIELIVHSTDNMASINMYTNIRILRLESEMAWYPTNLNPSTLISNSKHLQRLYCGGYEYLLDEHLEGRRITHLGCGNSKLSVDCIQALPLVYLECNEHITDAHIRGKQIQYLNCDWAHLTDDGIKDMPLVCLILGRHTDTLTDASLQTFTNLRMLDCEGNELFTDAVISKLRLEVLICNQTLGDDAIKHMYTLVILDCTNNRNVTDVGIMGLHSLRVLKCNNNLTDEGIGGLHLHELYCPPKHTLSDKALAGSMETLHILSVLEATFTGMTILSLKLDMLVLYESKWLRDIHHSDLVESGLQSDYEPSDEGDGCYDWSSYYDKDYDDLYVLPITYTRTVVCPMRDYLNDKHHDFCKDWCYHIHNGWYCLTTSCTSVKHSKYLCSEVLDICHGYL